MRPDKLSVVMLLNAFLLIVLWQINNPLLQQIIYYSLMFLMISFGLSHGALDWYQAKSLKFLQSSGIALMFITIYLGLALGFVGIWYVLPTMAWSIFLLISIWHFSNDWIGYCPLWFRWSFATLIVCMPALWHPVVINQLFALFIPAEDTPKLIEIMSNTAKVALFLSFIGLVRYQNINICLEWLILVIISINLPPILYFSFYFCQLHAYKHWRRHYDFHQKSLSKLLIPIILTSICVMVGLVIFLSHQVSTNKAIQLIFLELAALTIPHWLLIHIYQPLNNKRFK